MLTKLISLGADVNQRNSVGLTPLHIATMKGSKEYVRYLLRYGADPDVLTAEGQHCRDLTDDKEILSCFEDLNEIIPTSGACVAIKEEKNND